MVAYFIDAYVSLGLNELTGTDYPSTSEAILKNMGKTRLYLTTTRCKPGPISNISRTSLGDKIVDYSDVVGALPVSTAPTTPSLST